MIEIIDLKKKFISKKLEIDALKGINITIKDGEVYGIIGLSGAGKTTLLRCIAGLESPDEGTILIDGVDLSKLKGEEKRLFHQKIGVVFQGFNLLKQSSVYENIAFPLKVTKTPKEDIDKLVDDVLNLVGLSDKKYSYPVELSGGQVQRVAIARALVCNPKVLLLDEVTSALDPYTMVQIVKLLKSINEKYHVTMIVITHDMKVVRMLCDDLSILYEGEILEQGSKEEVIKHPKSDIGKFFLNEGEDHE